MTSMGGETGNWGPSGIYGDIKGAGRVCRRDQGDRGVCKGIAGAYRVCKALLGSGVWWDQRAGELSSVLPGNMGYF